MLLSADILLALLLLTSPPDTPATSAQRCLMPLLQQVAVSIEILDPRELRYILARPEDFCSDLEMLRRRYQDLADAPPLADSLRFPDRETVNELLAFNRAYRAHIETRQTVELNHWWEHRATLQETEALYAAWDTVRDCRCEYYYCTARRQALKRLRSLLGERDYYAGQLPPFVPLWRFEVTR